MKQVKKRIVQTILILVVGWMASANAFAQDISVKGNVKDSEGLEVIGANVVEKGNPQNGTVTDLNGNFTLTVPQDSYLLISFIGYQTVEVAAAPQINVTLKDDTELLNEVVIIGYGTARKDDLT